MIKQFEELLLSTNREGVEALLEFIRKSDFYTAPASTRFHSCHEGGLLEHSLNVYKCLKEKENNKMWAEVYKDIPEESLIICALLHDLCKTYFYAPVKKSRKTGRTLSNGKPEWEDYMGYEIDDKIPLGHGEKSVMIASKYIELTNDELYAIRFHMGWSEPKEVYNAVGKAMAKHKLVLALHEADQEATYLLEEEC